MSDITLLSIVDSEDKTIFEDDNYIIPLYQRAFAWSDKEITQLIDDIYDFEAEKYYIGSLIINVNSNGLYEVIDGQQRLAALYLLLNYLGYRWEKDRLRYECREKSNYTLNSLLPDEDDKNKPVDEDKIEQTLIKGRDIIDQKFRADKIDTEKFKEKLKNVKLFRIEVPPHTDLNRYFEIMNVRGEQLAQHDILKAELIGMMDQSDADAQKAFSVVWDACRNMDGYVQMHFTKQQREALFGGDWDWLNIDNIFSLKSDDCSVHPQTAIKIIENKEPIQVWDGDDEAGNRIRFESIIDFPFFLLHVLKVFVSVEFNEYFSAIPELLDDKKLLKTFTDIIDKWKSNGKSSKEFSLKFIKYLLKCRFLFDKYIIKREYKNEDTTGSWSLKELKVSGARSKKKPYYRDTYFGELNEWKTTYSSRTVTNLMLQSCLRVSYTSPKIMHWITELLKWLNVDDNLKKLSQFESQIEIIAQKPVIKFITDKNYTQGVNTPHIVLNYLDYLLWTKRSDAKYKGSGFVGGFNNGGRDALKGDNSISNGAYWGFIAKGEDNDEVRNRAAKMMLGANGYDGCPWNPLQNVNYVSCHDNYTLFDQLNYTLSDDGGVTEPDIKTVAKASVSVNGMVLMSNGISFINGGEELFRTKIEYAEKTQPDEVMMYGKRITHNSYKSSDLTNAYDYSRKAELYDYFKMYCDLIDLKKELSFSQEIVTWDDSTRTYESGDAVNLETVNTHDCQLAIYRKGKDGSAYHVLLTARKDAGTYYCEGTTVFNNSGSEVNSAQDGFDANGPYSLVIIKG